MKKKGSKKQNRRLFTEIVILMCFVIGVLIYAHIDLVKTAEECTEIDVQRGEGTRGSAAEVVSKTLQNRRALVFMGEGKDEVIITWQADKDGPRLVRYSGDELSLPVEVPIRAQRIETMNGIYRFKVKLTGLETGKRYYYEIGDGVVYDSPRYFDVAENGEAITFAYLGDPQFDRSVEDYNSWGRLTEQMRMSAPDVDFALMGGDMVNLPTKKAHWNGFLDNCGVFESLPLATVPGNHEGVTSNNTYKKMFHHIDNGPDGEAFYYFDRGSCRFIMLDSSFLTKARRVTMGSELWSAREQEVESWMRRTLEESTARWNIIVTHHPIYGMHDMFTVSKDLRELWLPILKEGGADLVLCGHQHVYMRTRDMDGMVHVMGVSGAKRSRFYTGLNEPAYSEAIYSAGPNYQIIRADNESLEITAYNEKGSIIDAAYIDKDIKFPYFRTFW